MVMGFLIFSLFDIWAFNICMNSWAAFYLFDDLSVGKTQQPKPSAYTKSTYLNPGCHVMSPVTRISPTRRRNFSSRTVRSATHSTPICVSHWKLSRCRFEMASKGKEVATGTSSSRGKRKLGGADEDNSGGGRKRRNREVLQFFEDTAEDDDDESNESDFDDDGIVETCFGCAFLFLCRILGFEVGESWRCLGT